MEIKDDLILRRILSYLDDTDLNQMILYSYHKNFGKYFLSYEEQDEVLKKFEEIGFIEKYFHPNMAVNMANKMTNYGHIMLGVDKLQEYTLFKKKILEFANENNIPSGTPSKDKVKFLINLVNKTISYGEKSMKFKIGAVSKIIYDNLSYSNPQNYLLVDKKFKRSFKKYFSTIITKLGASPFEIKDTGNRVEIHMNQELLEVIKK